MRKNDIKSRMIYDLIDQQRLINEKREKLCIYLIQMIRRARFADFAEHYNHAVLPGVMMTGSDVRSYSRDDAKKFSFRTLDHLRRTMKDLGNSWKDIVTIRTRWLGVKELQVSIHACRRRRKLE